MSSKDKGAVKGCHLTFPVAALANESLNRRDESVEPLVHASLRLSQCREFSLVLNLAINQDVDVLGLHAHLPPPPQSSPHHQLHDALQAIKPFFVRHFLAPFLLATCFCAALRRRRVPCFHLNLHRVFSDLKAARPASRRKLIDAGLAARCWRDVKSSARTVSAGGPARGDAAS